jgi:hypothetical protein
MLSLKYIKEYKELVDNNIYEVVFMISRIIEYFMENIEIMNAEGERILWALCKASNKKYDISIIDFYKLSKKIIELPVHLLSKHNDLSITKICNKKIDVYNKYKMEILKLCLE